MPESLTRQKAALRAEARAAVKNMSPADRASASRLICERLTAQRVWQNARAVLLFMPMPDEPDIRPLLQAALEARKTVALPQFVAAGGHYEAAVICDPARDLVAGKFGIPEPGAVCKVADLKRLDLVLVPALAFDWHGRRLGRGKGFYDRLLVDVPGKTCGVAFDQQMVAALPVEPHDVRLNCILTPSHWLEF
jgi:5-formyltetrahydrofolate cyclo-ligase